MNYKLINFCEIDKYAVKSYCAIHGVSDTLNLGDITQVNIDELPKCNLITHGSPCQDFSSLGLEKGGDEDKETRSSLIWNSVKIIKHCVPKFVIWENVENVLSKKHIHNFEKYLSKMSEFGYKNYYKVLNAKDYGIPQSRNRLFCISIREDIDCGFEFPEPIELKETLLDYVDLTNKENLYGREPQNSHQEWKQEMYKMYIDASDGVISGVYTNQSRSFGYRPPLKNLAKTIKALASDCGFVYGNQVRNYTAKESLMLMGYEQDDYNKMIKVVTEQKIKKQAGNSIVVNVVYEIFKQLQKYYPDDFKDLDVISLFSGIGAFEKALDKLCNDING